MAAPRHRGTKPNGVTKVRQVAGAEGPAALPSSRLMLFSKAHEPACSATASPADTSQHGMPNTDVGSESARPTLGTGLRELSAAWVRPEFVDGGQDAFA